MILIYLTFRDNQTILAALFRAGRAAPKEGG